MKEDLADPEKGRRLEQMAVNRAAAGDTGCSEQDSLGAGRIEVEAHIVAEVEAKVVGGADAARLLGTHHVETGE